MLFTSIFLKYSVWYIIKDDQEQVATWQNEQEPSPPEKKPLKTTWKIQQLTRNPKINVADLEKTIKN